VEQQAYTGALYSHPGHIDKEKLRKRILKIQPENLYKLFRNLHRSSCKKIVLETHEFIFRVALSIIIFSKELIKKVGHEKFIVY